MAVRKLTVDIVSMLKGDGFKKTDVAVNKLKGGFSSLSQSSLGTFATMGAGIIGVTGLAQGYERAISEATGDTENLSKLTSAMKGQGFSEDAIKRVYDYSQSLQDYGVVAGDTIVAGMQQLATYNLTEQQLKNLAPALANVAVQQDGVNASNGTAVRTANMLAKGIMGQTGELRQAGITLTEYQESLIKTGTQSEKVNAIIEAVRMNVGEQNREMASRDIGVVAQSQNKIADAFKSVGFRLMKTRVEIYRFLGDNLDLIVDFTSNSIDFFQDMGSGAKKAITGIWDAFQDMPPELQTTVKLLGGLTLANVFPWVAIALAVEDIYVAFKGGKSVTEPAFDSLMEFAGYDYRFKDLREDVQGFFSEFDAAKAIGQSVGFLAGQIQALSGAVIMLDGVAGMDWDQIKKGANWFNEGSGNSWDSFAGLTNNIIGGTNVVLENHGNNPIPKIKELPEIKIPEIVIPNEAFQKIDTVGGVMTFNDGDINVTGLTPEQTVKIVEEKYNAKIRELKAQLGM